MRLITIVFLLILSIPSFASTVQQDLSYASQLGGEIEAMSKNDHEVQWRIHVLLEKINYAQNALENREKQTQSALSRLHDCVAIADAMPMDFPSEIAQDITRCIDQYASSVPPQDCVAAARHIPPAYRTEEANAIHACGQSSRN